jgi:hypothetical protein
VLVHSPKNPHVLEATLRTQAEDIQGGYQSDGLYLSYDTPHQERTYELTEDNPQALPKVIIEFQTKPPALQLSDIQTLTDAVSSSNRAELQPKKIFEQLVSILQKPTVRQVLPKPLMQVTLEDYQKQTGFIDAVKNFKRSAKTNTPEPNLSVEIQLEPASPASDRQQPRQSTQTLRKPATFLMHRR